MTDPRDWAREQGTAPPRVDLPAHTAVNRAMPDAPPAPGAATRVALVRGPNITGQLPFCNAPGLDRKPIRRCHGQCGGKHPITVF
ncbi:hypothetical protein GCM10023205_27830 [Yinghuangia aomiensis]|uniref:Uncharacterized protein n=1 Tax=Yinghuangia aomiensis TaxID=676205 RepID=A0ABP9H6T9_9ACTN